jgi:hypothetical protein
MERARSKPWWPGVRVITALRRYKSRKALERAEAIAIRDEEPPYNIVKPFTNHKQLQRISPIPHAK